MNKSIRFLRRGTGVTEVAPVPDSTPLPDRVQEARDRVAHQHDPALLNALSDQELAADRALIERVRDHERREQIARVEADAKAAHRVRRTIDKLAEQQAADLLRAEQAVAEQRHASSPHTKVARLHRRKSLALRILTGVLVIAMVISAVSVQHNIAPTGGPGNVWWWMAYGIEFLISGTLIALMMSTGDSADWDVIEAPWRARTIEAVLLGVTVLLNTFPYLKNHEWGQIGAHGIAPVIIGTTLYGYSVVAGRYSQSIERATAALAHADPHDLTTRLGALTRIGAVHELAPVPALHRARQDAGSIDSGHDVSALPDAPATEGGSRGGASESPDAPASTTGVVRTHRRVAPARRRARHHSTVRTLRPRSIRIEAGIVPAQDPPAPVSESMEPVVEQAVPADRDALIRELKARGMSSRQIAPLIGVAPSTVTRVLDRAKAATADAPPTRGVQADAPPAAEPVHTTTRHPGLQVVHAPEHAPGEVIDAELVEDTEPTSDRTRRQA